MNMSFPIMVVVLVVVVVVAVVVIIYDVFTNRKKKTNSDLTRIPFVNKSNVEFYCWFANLHYLNKTLTLKIFYHKKPEIGM